MSVGEIPKELISDEEFKELGYTREQAMFMYGIDVECDITKLRMAKMGLSFGGFPNYVKYLEKFEPHRAEQAALIYYEHLLNGTIEGEK